MNSKRVIWTLLVLIGLMAYLNISDFSIVDMTGRAQLNPEQDILSESSVDPAVLFCPRDGCGHTLEFIINNSDKIHCAFFDLDLPEVIGALEAKNASVVVDADNYDIVEGKITNLKKDTRTAFMHNKFCVFDDSIVLTGSFNPTMNGDQKNNNNMIVLSSSILAENYEAEFSELWNGVFGKGDLVRNPVFEFNGNMIENYFCPEDWCANKILKALSYANESIYFMTFSFTHDQTGDLILEKHRQGVDVKGLFEKSQNSQYSEFSRMNASGIDVRFDTNPAMMHHKVFIIDKKIVVTGSMNPSSNGDTKNDENVMIVHDEDIAGRYLAEYGLLTQ